MCLDKHKHVVYLSQQLNGILQYCVRAVFAVREHVCDVRVQDLWLCGICILRSCAVQPIISHTQNAIQKSAKVLSCSAQVEFFSLYISELPSSYI